MLGIVFSEFMDMVDDTFGPEVLDQLLDIAENQLDSNGDYTAVGNYDHGEMLVLVTELSKSSGISVADLVEAYGKHLFGRFHHRYPAFFEEINGTMDFLAGIENRIHKEVRKLYPNAELPTFEVSRAAEDTMTLVYSSERPFARLAKGLIDGCTEFFKDGVKVAYEDLSDGAMTKARFELSYA